MPPFHSAAHDLAPGFTDHIIGPHASRRSCVRDCGGGLPPIFSL